MSLILGIESSCDETAAAIVKDGDTVVASEVASQIAVHARHGGVVPELAAREHLKALNPVLSAVLEKAGVALDDISAVAVTQGPGLIPALLVGLSFAKGLAAGYRLPLIGVNHFFAHIYGAFLDGGRERLLNRATYPLLALVVSGGHTSLLLVSEDGSARQLGCTIDDAAGEALDKGAKLLGLGYPGGPAVQRAAMNGDPAAFDFPRPLTGAAGKALSDENRYNFSFSGIKTSLLYKLRDINGDAGRLPEATLADIAASYQYAVVDVLVRKTMAAARAFKVKTLVAAGGVACNAELRRRLAGELPDGMELLIAPPKYCTDNAAMVGGAGWHDFRHGDFSKLDIDAFSRLPVISRVPFAGTLD